MNTVRIFIASSSELVADRQEFREFLGVENDLLRERKGYLELNQWEYFNDAISSTRKQDDYNEALKKCDIVVCLFHTKAGKYTLEEFDTALTQFKLTGKPLIYTYFKTETPATESKQSQSLIEFKKRLDKLGHFYTTYSGIDSLKLHFRRQLDLLENKGIIVLREQAKFIVGKKAFNEQLTKELIKAIRPYCNPAERFLEKVVNIPSWETQIRISDKAKEIIAYSFVGVIGKQLSKLMAIGKEDFSESKQRKYIEKCLHITKRTLDLTCWALLSELWELRKEKTIEFNGAQIQVISNRLTSAFEPSIVEQYKFLSALAEIFSSKKNKLSSLLPLPWFCILNNGLKDNNSFPDIINSFQSLNECIDRSEFNMLDCFEAENRLAEFLQCFSFLANYNMVSIKQIGFRQMRASAPSYLHRYVALGIDSKANVDAEKVNFTNGTVHTNAILLYQGEDYKNSINLFPFVIDYNALTFENGAKICFFLSKDIVDDSLEYLFLEDNKAINIDKEGIVDQGTDINELMLKQEKLKILNLDWVVDTFSEAQGLLVDGEGNLNDE